ncbi:MAG: hypothetical protein JXA83_14905, partial [Acidimicrobiales bacterium]|nr:hypothetical protein [Acidimicrobiales bacterium]
PRRRHTGLVVAGGLAAVALVLTGLAVMTDETPGPSGGTDRQAPTDGAAGGDADAAGADGSAEHVTEGSPDESVTDAASPALVTAGPPGGGFAVDIPGSWSAGYPDAGAAPLVDQMLTPAQRAEPGAAGQIEQVEAALVTPETRMLALDPDAWTGLRPPDMLVVDRVVGLDPGTMDVGEMADLIKTPGGGVTLGAEGRLTGASGDVAWFEVELVGFDFSGVRYVATGPDSVWLITYWSDDLATARPAADAILASFAPA